MTPWLVFILSGTLLTLFVAGGYFFLRQKDKPATEIRKQVDDAPILHILLWLALLSILAYIVFVFGKG